MKSLKKFTDLDKYTFDEDVVFFGVGDKIGSITRDEIKKLRKL